MPSSLYDRFKVGPTASHAELIRAYQREVAELLARIESAREHGADAAPLEHQKRELQEAKSILLEPQRRNRYDAFLSRFRNQLPHDAAELWSDMRTDIVDPRLISALEFVRSTSNFQFGGLLKEVQTPENQTQPMVASAPQVKAPSPKRHLKHTRSKPKARIKNTEKTVAVQTKRQEPKTVEQLLKSHGHTGRFLKAIREQRGQSVDELSELTHITKEMLIALEQHQFDRLPASPYVKGWIDLLSEELELENTDFSAQFYAMLSRRRQRPS
jgi:hypothetical protein